MNTFILLIAFILPCKFSYSQHQNYLPYLSPENSWFFVFIETMKMLS